MIERMDSPDTHALVAAEIIDARSRASYTSSLDDAKPFSVSLFPYVHKIPYH
jgi:hypothetical protein